MGGKNAPEKKKKALQPKEIIENVFIDYFDAYKMRKDFLKSGDESVNNLEFNLISYNETIENIEKDRNIKKILLEEKYFHNHSGVNFQIINLNKKNFLFSII